MKNKTKLILGVILLIVGIIGLRSSYFCTFCGPGYGSFNFYIIFPSIIISIVGLYFIIYSAWRIRK